MYWGDTHPPSSHRFFQGDMLYLEKPYAKPNADGSFCLEYGPATVVYMRPFQPRQVSYLLTQDLMIQCTSLIDILLLVQEMVCTQQAHEPISVPVAKTLDVSNGGGRGLWGWGGEKGGAVEIQLHQDNVVWLMLHATCTCNYLYYIVMYM